jgi:hypothetical protein
MTTHKVVKILEEAVMAYIKEGLSKISKNLRTAKAQIQDQNTRRDKPV